MAALYSKELWPGRGSEDGIQRLLKHRRYFEVRTDDPEDSGVIAGAEADLPRNGDPHPDDPDRIMVRITADNDANDPTLWLVVCEYDSDLPAEQAREAGSFDPATGASVPGGDGGDHNVRADNPLDRPTRWAVEFEQAQEIVKKDIDGNAIVNSAGLPYDPPPMADRAFMVITAVKNYAVGDSLIDLSGSVGEYIDTLNDNVFLGCTAGTLRIVGASINYDVENGVPFAQVTWRFKHRRFGWALSLADIGTMVLSAGEFIPVSYIEGTGSDTGPRPLDGSGGLLAPGLPLEFFDFNVYPELDFSALNL